MDAVPEAVFPGIGWIEATSRDCTAEKAIFSGENPEVEMQVVGCA